MTLRFTGSYVELQERLTAINSDGSWTELNDNQKQFRHRNGGILNWYPSTGAINFQGKPEGKRELEAIVASALSSSTASAEGSASTQVDAVRFGDKQAASSPSPTGLDASEQRPAELAAATLPTQDSDLRFLSQEFNESELVIGLVGAVGTDLRKVIDVLESRLRAFGCSTHEVHVSTDVIPKLVPRLSRDFKDEHQRITTLMDAGNIARRQSGDNSALALGTAAYIASGRTHGDAGHGLRPKNAFIVYSLKHPEEVTRLREIYPQGFYLVGVHADEKRRHQYLTEEKRIAPDLAEELMRRDEDEHLPYGQRTSDTFHLSDFFVRLDENQDKLRNSLWRVLDILFGNPYVTPTFDEFAMFMAFSAALRSADLSRQVGAVITKDREIVATGANDSPKYGGGLYWPEFDAADSVIKDAEDGRDYKRGEDSNKVEQQKMIEDILRCLQTDATDVDSLREVLANSRIKDITEYGRVVHAEMEALLCCARSNISSRGAQLFCTTFPCHNCAKHIIAAGVERVVYVEPYHKSKAAEFHSDSISLGFSEKADTVHFEPFVGVGPRRFFDLFSMKLGSGYPLKRKDSEGQVLEWKPETARLRVQMIPRSYVELEAIATTMFRRLEERQQVESAGAPVEP